MIQPENRPLPQLPPPLLKEIDTARALAQARLLDSLNDCWTRSFHADATPRTRAPEPQAFFAPFVAYGVTLYDTFGGTLLKLDPDYSDYLDWMDFGLKSRICEEIAPLWSVEQREQSNSIFPGCRIPNSGWENSLGHAWRIFDHPQHNALEREAQKLIRSLRDPLDNHWDRFLTLLHNAMSRKTPHWRAKGVELLGNTAANGETPGIRDTQQRWEDIEFFIDDHQIEIRIAGKSETCGYAAFGFQDKRTGNPDQQWAVLQVFARLDQGVMPDDARQGKEWLAIAKRVERVRKLLQKRFGLADDPIPYEKGRGYIARFKIRSVPDSSGSS